MTTFKEIRGQLIRSVSSDPANPQEGQIWYNNTIGVLKGYTFTAAAWSSGGNLPRIRFDNMGAKLETRNAALSVGGYSPVTPGVGAPNTDEYNGTSWTAGGNLNTARVSAATGGTQTSAIAAGGDDYSPSQQSAAEEYNGSSWTSVTSMPFSANRRSAAGSQTAAIYIGGFTAGPTGNTTTQADEYDGTSWTTVTAYPQSAQQISSTGVQTAALSIGGGSKPTPGSSTVYLDDTVAYDGTTWTASTNYPKPARNIGTGGTQTDALLFAGIEYTAPGAPPQTFVKTSQSFDGTTWVASANLSVNGGDGTGSGSATSGDSLIFGGYDGANTLANTEEFTGAFFSTQTLTTS